MAEVKKGWVQNGDTWEYYDEAGKFVRSFDASIRSGNWKKDGYKTNNPLTQGQTKHVRIAIEQFLKTGTVPGRTDFYGPGDLLNPTKAGYDNIIHDLKAFLSKHDIDYDDYKYSMLNNGVPSFITPPMGGTDPIITDDDGNIIEDTAVDNSPFAATPQDDAFNKYYNDLYSGAPGTGGRAMLDNLTGIYQQEAQVGMNLADAQYQTQALQQAQTVKMITDQVRSERMNRLRAGMSEAQIANQDMQMMMANVNTLNQNAQMMGQQRLEANAGMDLAQGEAYKSFLDQANARGQNAAAFRAADAGDANFQTIQTLRMKYPQGWTSKQYDEEHGRVTNSTPATN